MSAPAARAAALRREPIARPRPELGDATVGGARGCGSRGRRADISSLPQRLRRLRATNAVYTPGGGGVSEMSRGGVGDAPRRADGRRGWDAGASEDEFATHTISHLEIGFFFEALSRKLM